MELVTPDETGLLFKPDDFEDLAAQLRTLLTSPGALKRMAVAASARIRSQFSHRTAAARMAEIYRRNACSKRYHRIEARARAAMALNVRQPPD